MKINLRIDVSKLDKNRFTKNSYTKRDGTQVNEINADLVLIEKKEPKVLKEGDTWTLMETHFIAEKREKDEEANYVGVGTQFVDKNDSRGNFDAIDAMPNEDTIDISDVPF